MGIKEVFEAAYLKAFSIECPQGEGSEEYFVRKMGTLDFISRIINEKNIKSINDCACGLFENWARFLPLENVDI